MKIRSDFVTNSSSSSFVLDIDIYLKSGDYVSFHGHGGTGETGRVDYFDTNATVRVSPKQLGTASSVEEMIQLLTDGVLDEYWGEATKIFAESNPRQSECGYEVFDAFDFIVSIREKVGSMDDIERIVITGNEYNYMEYLREFSYNCITGEYTGEVFGCDFEKDGSSGGDLCFDIKDCDVTYTEDDEDCDD